MPKYQLSILHKILIASAAVVFLLTMVAVVALGWTNWQNVRPAPIIVTVTNGNVISTTTDKQVSELEFGETFRVQAESASFKWGNNQLMLVNGSSGVISRSEVKLTQGKGLVIVASASTLTIQDATITSKDLVGIIDIPRAVVTVFAGSLSNNGTAITSGSEISLVNTTNISKFNRQLLISDQGISQLRQLAISNGAATNSLSDVTPPQLTNILPRNGGTVSSKNITITGVIDDVNAEMSIDGVEVANRNGQLNYTVSLEEGDNVFTVTLTDTNGNVSTTELVYRYLNDQPASGEAETDSGTN